MNVRRNLKHKVGSFTPIQVKVREATSNEAWGPPTALMSDICDAVQNSDLLEEVFQIVWKRLGDDGKNWRHVHKSLILVDYLIKSGPMSVVEVCTSQAYAINSLKTFQFEDKDGKDQGAHIRERAKQISMLLKDPDHLRTERNKALGVRRGMDNGRPTSPPGIVTSPNNGIRRSASNTALSGQERHLDRIQSGPPEEKVGIQASKSSHVLGSFGTRPRANNDPWASPGAVPKANPASPLPVAKLKADNDPWASPPSSSRSPHPGQAAQSQSMCNLHSNGFDNMPFGARKSESLAHAAVAPRLVTETVRDEQPAAASASMSSPNIACMPQPSAGSAFGGSQSGSRAVSPSAFGDVGAISEEADMTASTASSQAVKEEEASTFLEGKATELVDLKNVMNVKERPQPVKHVTSLNDIRYSQATGGSNFTASGASGASGPILASPLIPSPQPGQQRIQPGQTWAPGPSQGVTSVAPPPMAVSCQSLPSGMMQPGQSFVPAAQVPMAAGMPYAGQQPMGGAMYNSLPGQAPFQQPVQGYPVAAANPGYGRANNPFL